MDTEPEVVLDPYLVHSIDKTQRSLGSFQLGVCRMDDPLVGALDAPAKSQKILVGARESSWTASCPMDTACDRLRAKLMEFGVSRGEYGKIGLGPSSTTAFARKEVRP